MRTALITGGAGFLGSHLTKSLLDDGYEVVCVDNFYTGTKRNIEPFLRNENFRYIGVNVATPNEKWDELAVDEIYNLACPASPKHYQRYPVQTIKTCIQGSINVLELAKQNSAKVLQASTSEVYGDPLEHPQNENYWGNVNPIGIRSCYDEGKRAAETLFCDYKRQYGIDIRIARIFNTYGPNMSPDDGRVVSNFIIQALKNKPITIYGNGLQTRSFCYVDDLVDGLRRLMKSTITTPINLGNPAEFTILELAQLVIELTNSKSEIIYLDLPSDDPKQRQPDITLAIHELDFLPTTKLRIGLTKTIDYFSKVLK